MSYKFLPPHPDRSYGQSPQGFVPSPTPSHPYDWQAQQSLFMGMNTVTYHHQILVSPQVSNTVSNFGATSSTYQAQTNSISSPFSGRVIYSSSAYN